MKLTLLGAIIGLLVIVAASIADYRLTYFKEEAEDDYDN